MRITGNRLWRFLCLGLLAGQPALTEAAALPAVEQVIQHQFPAQQARLQALTDALFSEYQQRHNVVSLIFYAYGMLQLADRFTAENKLIKAAEYARTGFFYLDEAAEQHETDARVRYLRARLDAWLPATLGRCVITLSDTQFILETPLAFDREIRSAVQYMRYRALYSCQQYRQAAALLAQLKQQHPQFAWLGLAQNAAPVWRPQEIMQTVWPLTGGQR